MLCCISPIKSKGELFFRTIIGTGKNPNVAAEIEKIIRDEASAISKELEGNPSANEKISDKKEEE